MEADLFRIGLRTEQGMEEMEHFTNIHRMAHLAANHPLVEVVEPHKLGKALDRSEFDETGRCTKFHQSPWDVKLILAASGASMLVGVTVHNIHPDLLSLWWQPLGREGELTPQTLLLMDAIFFDICEAEHRVPPTFRGLFQPAAAAAPCAPPHKCRRRSRP